jgi:hypothetical protein
LGATILRMISTQSLPAINRDAPVQPLRGTAPARMEEASAPASQRPLEAMPVQPTRPVPRGSLLDLRV